jgi:hypothetical protein
MPFLARALTYLIAAGLLYAQGSTPKEKAADYQAHAQLDGFEIAAEYLVHSIPVTGGVLDTRDYLVLEVAIYPKSRETPVVSSGDFTLKVNHGRSVLSTQAPGMVAASVKYPDWEVRPTLEGSVGVGGTDVILGRPQTTGRFPGDPGLTSPDCLASPECRIRPIRRAKKDRLPNQ